LNKIQVKQNVSSDQVKSRVNYVLINIWKQHYIWNTNNMKEMY